MIYYSFGPAVVSSPECGQDGTWEVNEQAL